MKNIISSILLFLIIISLAACAASQSNFKVGRQYYDDGNYEQAIIELEKAARNDTSIHDRINAFEYLGDTYARKGNLDAAVLSYKNAYNLIHVRIGEIIDRRKALRSDKSISATFSNSNAGGNAEKLNDEQSKLSVRAEEMHVKIKHLK